MDRYLSQKDALTTSADMTQRVLADARRTFTGADTGVLEHCASQVVAELWSESIKVKTFLPVLAMRRIRETLETQNPVGSPHGSGGE